MDCHQLVDDYYDNLSSRSSSFVSGKSRELSSATDQIVLVELHTPPRCKKPFSKSSQRKEHRMYAGVQIPSNRPTYTKPYFNIIIPNYAVCILYPDYCKANTIQLVV